MLFEFTLDHKLLYFEILTNMYTVHVYTVHCTLYTVCCTPYTCTPYTCTLYTCTLYTCTLYTVHCTLYTVHCTPYTMHCTLYAVQCTLYSVHCTHVHMCTALYLTSKLFHTLAYTFLQITALPEFILPTPIQYLPIYLKSYIVWPIHYSVTVLYYHLIYSPYN